jgi:hypothetical protein
VTAAGSVDSREDEAPPTDVLAAISPEFADTLPSLRGRFLDLLEVPAHETMALAQLTRSETRCLGGHSTHW